MSYLHRSVLKSPNMRMPPRAKAGQSKDYTPLTWEKYFKELQNIVIDDNSFRIYLSGTEGPVLALIHGGGYSALTWALFTKEIVQRIQCRVIAIDVRGHGETQTTADENLNIENLSTDIINILTTIYGVEQSVVIIGHSMGGSIAVHSAQKLKNCVGLVVIDVVEGTALESLSSMQNFLRNRPKSFINIEHAIQWCYKSGQTQNLESARVSMPGQIKNTITGKLAASELVDCGCQQASCTNIDTNDVIEKEIGKKTPTGIEIIAEDEVSANSEQSEQVFKPPSSYTWRIDLSNTESHWQAWFQGLSELFLNTPVPKLLLLANIHGLDTALTVGQMQGKFQMKVLPRCGHAIHEDLPDKVADVIATYLVKQKIAEAIGEFTPSLPGC